MDLFSRANFKTKRARVSFVCRWPTGMYAATHGVVFAQLIIDGTHHGVFGFFMQFRDEEGNLMPGVEIGEIGPKMGQGETNIGCESASQALAGCRQPHTRTRIPSVLSPLPSQVLSCRATVV